MGSAAASVNYGRVPKDAQEILAGACPIVASYGGKDKTIRGGAPRLDQALTDLGIPHDVREYPAAGHGFLNAHQPAQPLRALLRVAGNGGGSRSRRQATPGTGSPPSSPRIWPATGKERLIACGEL